MGEHIDEDENRLPEHALNIDLLATCPSPNPDPLATSPLTHRHARTNLRLEQIILPTSQGSVAKKFVIENGPTNLELRVFPQESRSA
jgi:hypothetical protein